MTISRIEKYYGEWSLSNDDYGPGVSSLTPYRKNPLLAMLIHGNSFLAGEASIPRQSLVTAF